MKTKRGLLLGIIYILFLLNPGLSLADNSPWPMFGHDRQHTGRSPYVGVQTALLKWTSQLNVTSNMIIGGDNTVYIGSQDNVYALDGTTGSQKWVLPDLVYTTSGLGLALGVNSTLYVTSAVGKVYALDGATGTQKWVSTIPSGVTSPAIGSDGTVYVGSTDYNVYALDGATGTKKWSFTTGSFVYSSPAIGTDGTVYVGSYDGNVYALDGTTGTQKWAFPTGSYVWSSPAIGADGTVYVGSADGKVYALYPASGTQKWVSTIPNGVTSPAIGVDGTVFVGSPDYNVYALDGATGTKKWAFTTGGGVPSSPAIGADGTVYVGSDDGNVYALDGATGTKKWAFTTGGSMGYWQTWSSPAIGADGTVYVGYGSSFGFFGQGQVYAFGTITVPNVVGMTEANAESTLQAVGLTVGSFNSVYSNTVQATYIISQNPPAGTSVAAGSSVDLTTSLGPVPATMTVPNVVGMTQADAENYLLSVALLNTGTVSQVYSSTVTAGYVISQDPAAGTTVATYSAVNLTVSLGPAPSNVTVPDVTNMSQASAQSTLTAAGLAVGAISQANSSTVPVGYVISQNPSAGASVASGTSVNLTLSLGPQVTMISVPNVVGLLQANAQSAITSAGLTVGTITQAYSATVPSGNVISQSPAAGISVAPGTTVNLTVSLGTGPITVPILGLFNTGVDNSGAALPIGSLDPHYVMTGPESTAYVIQKCTPWVTPPSSNTTWIGPTDGFTASSSGDYHDVLTFDLTGLDLTTAVISGTVAADNTVKILLNGVDTGVSTPNQNNLDPYSMDSFENLHNFVLNSGFVSGINTIDFVVSNYQFAGGGNSPSGLLVTNLSGSAASLGPQTGSVTVPNVVGMTQAAAQSTLTSAGLATGTITQAYNSTVVSGNVISQSPASGASVALGTAVNLMVSIGSLQSIINPWPMSGHDCQQMCLSPYIGTQNADLKWVFGTNNSYRYTIPAISADGTVYVGNGDDYLYALDGTTGDQRWVFPTSGSIIIGSDGTVYVINSNIYALDPSSGNQKWVYAAPGIIPGGTVLGNNGKMYIQGGGVFALDPFTGNQIWTFKEGASEWMTYGSSPAIGSDGTVFAGSTYSFYAIDGDTGSQKWGFTPGSQVGFVTPSIGPDWNDLCRNPHRSTLCLRLGNGQHKMDV